MSSQALATAPLGGGGLPSAPSPPTNTPPQMDESWDTHMPDLESQSHVHDQKDVNSIQTNDVILNNRTPSVSNTNHDERVQQHRQALNNLMAALNQTGGNLAEQTNESTSLPHEDSQVTNTNVVEGSDNHFVTGANKRSLTPFQPSGHDPVFNGPAFTDLPPLPFDHNISPSNFPSQDHQFTIPFPPMEPSVAPRAAPRKIGAFAKLNFDDGHYYMSTYQIELGRDAIAYQDALRREKQEQDGLQLQAQSSSGRMSRHSDRIKHGGDSQVPGSVVSEAGGFAGLDDMPIGASESAADPKSHPSRSSELSASDVINPNDLLIAQNFDYAIRAEVVAAYEGGAQHDDGEQPAPVTAEHMPDPNICPLIPIHAMIDSDIPELTTHKMISRRHARIEWSVRDESFVIETLGRNGIFVDKIWHGRKSRRLLKHGSLLQIAGIQIRFELPRLDEPELEHDMSLPEYDGASPERPNSITPISSMGSRDTTPVPKVTLKLQNRKSSPSDPTGQPAQPVPVLGPDGQPYIRKRGPGRPPKDGIMSTRERKEREKAAKAAEAKAANGGTTPPPSARNKLARPPTKEELARFEAQRQEKKKPATTTTTAVKRRREDDGDIMPSIEGADENVPSDSEKQPIKKARQSKSPSPEYAALASLTEDQLARPSDPYARLIYDILIEIYPKALPLKQIYRAIKSKFPFFVHRVESDGWQSSVRHNLNQEWNKLFEKGEKEGKGFAWKAIPGALQPAEQRKRQAQAAAAAKPKPQQQRQQNQPGAGNWNQNQPGYWPPNGFPPPPNGMPWPPGQGPPQQGQPPRPFPPGQNGAGRGAASGVVPVPLPAPGAPNMPCTLDGFLAIRRFEHVMYSHADKVPGSNGADRLKTVFNSIKARLLHGAPASTLPGVETKEEKAIMSQVQSIVERFKNPAFQGYQIKPLSRGQSPAVNAQVAPRPQNGAQGPRPPNAPAQAPPRPPSTPLARTMNPASVPLTSQGSQQGVPTATAIHYPPPTASYLQQLPNTPNTNGGPSPQGVLQQQHGPSNPNMNSGLPQGQQQQRPSTPNLNGAPTSQMQRPPSAAPYPPQAPLAPPGVNAAQRSQTTPMQLNGQLQRPPSRNGQQQQPVPVQQGVQHVYPSQAMQQPQQGVPQQSQQHHRQGSIQQAHQPGPPPQGVQQQQGPTQQGMQQRPPSQPAQQQQGLGQQSNPPVPQQAHQPSYPPQPAQQQQFHLASSQRPQSLQHQQNGQTANSLKSADVPMPNAPPPPNRFQTVGQAAAASYTAAANNTVPPRVSAPLMNGNTVSGQTGNVPTASAIQGSNSPDPSNNSHAQSEPHVDRDGSGDVQMTPAPALSARVA